MIKRAYGYVPDKLDARDHVYAKVVAPSKRPAAMDLVARMPPIVDQGQLGACTGNGVAACVDFLHAGKGKDWAGPSSRLQIYYDERVVEGTIKQDSGAQIRDGIKVVNKTGAALESLWPYDISKFAKKPPAAAYADAAKRRVTAYQRLSSINDMADCIAAGFPFVFGFSVPASFEGEGMAKTGKMIWKKSEQTVGGHCVVGVGYDFTTNLVLCRNSWGADWGVRSKRGHFWMPFDWIADPNCASDFWTIRA